MIICIVQARMDSKRLPGKVMRLINNKPMIFYTLKSLRKSRYIDKIILATSDSNKDDKLAQYIQKLKIELFRGSESNVLERFKRVSDKYKADVVVRITGDCPLINPFIVDNAVTKFLIYDYDYIRLDVPHTFQRGFDVEVFSKNALDKAYFEICSKENINKAEYDKFREHVTLYLYTHKEKFKIGYVKGEGEYLNNRNINLSVDTMEDFERVRKIIESKNNNLYM